MCYLVRLLGLRRACRVSYRRKTPVEHHRNVTAHAVPQNRMDKVALGTRPFRLSGCQFGILFVPPGVALMLYFDVITAQFWPIVIATVVSTVLVLVVTGWSHQLTRKTNGLLRK